MGGWCLMVPASYESAGIILYSPEAAVPEGGSCGVSPKREFPYWDVCHTVLPHTSDNTLLRFIVIRYHYTPYCYIAQCRPWSPDCYRFPGTTLRVPPHLIQNINLRESRGSRQTPSLIVRLKSKFESLTKYFQNRL